MSTTEKKEPVAHIYKYDYGTSLSVCKSENTIILCVKERKERERGPEATVRFSKEAHPMTFEFMELLRNIIAQRNREKQWAMDPVIRYFEEKAEEEGDVDEYEGDPEGDGTWERAWQDDWEENPIRRQSDVEGDTLTLTDDGGYLYRLEISQTVGSNQLIARINFDISMETLIFVCLAKLAQSMYEDNTANSGG